MIRSATSPRLAIRIFLNNPAYLCPYREKPLAVLHGLAAFDVDVHDLPVVFGVDFVHQLHRFDDAEHLPLLHAGADLDEGRRPGLGRSIERADNRRLDDGELDVGLVVPGGVRRAIAAGDAVRTARPAARAAGAAASAATAAGRMNHQRRRPRLSGPSAAVPRARSRAPTSRARARDRGSASTARR